MYVCMYVYIYIYMYIHIYSIKQVTSYIQVFVAEAERVCIYVHILYIKY